MIFEVSKLLISLMPPSNPSLSASLFLCDLKGLGAGPAFLVPDLQPDSQSAARSLSTVVFRNSPSRALKLLWTNSRYLVIARRQSR